VLSRLVRQPASEPAIQSSRLCTLLRRNGAAISVSANEFTRDVLRLLGRGVSELNCESLEVEPGNWIVDWPAPPSVVVGNCIEFCDSTEIDGVSGALSRCKASFSTFSCSSSAALRRKGAGVSHSFPGVKGREREDAEPSSDT
jgi:hypothetical protein